MVGGLLAGARLVEMVLEVGVHATRGLIMVMFSGGREIGDGRSLSC
jgi:hypothetical protein